MGGKTTLIVFHSVTGNTEAAVRAVADPLDAEVERVEPLSSRQRKPGLFGIVIGGYRALRRKVEPVRPPKNDPTSFDRVIVASPIWGGHLTPAIRGWFAALTVVPSKVGLIATSGSTAPTGIIGDIADLVGEDPSPVLHITDRDRKTGADREKIEAFVGALG